MSNILLNGNSKKIILNGTQYLGSADSPALVTKTITQNGTYLATNDNADGYSEVTVNVSGTPLDTINITDNGTYHPQSGRGFGEVNVDVSGGDFGSLTPLEYWYKDTDDGTEGSTPEYNLALTYDSSYYYVNHTNHHEGYPRNFTHWNSETKYIEILQDFDAVLQYTLHGYKDSYNYAQGALYVNDVQVSFLQALYARYTSKFIPVSLHVGDTLAIRKPEDKGWSYHELYINYVGDPNPQE